jgi:hypothetical protein
MKDLLDENGLDHIKIFGVAAELFCRKKLKNYRSMVFLKFIPLTMEEKWGWKE